MDYKKFIAYFFAKVGERVKAYGITLLRIKEMAYNK